MDRVRRATYQNQFSLKSMARAVNNSNMESLLKKRKMSGTPRLHPYSKT